MPNAETSNHWTIERLFEGRPENRERFEEVRRFIESLGPVEVAVTKTQVSFGVRAKFAWVWLPQMWSKKRPEHCVVLTFALDHHETDPRIVDAVEPRLGRWTHHVIIQEPSDLDDQVKGWLREAHASGTIDRRKRKEPLT